MEICSHRTGNLLDTQDSFREILSLPGHQRGSLFKDERLVEVSLIVDAVLDLLAVLVQLADRGPPASQVLVEVDSDNFVRGQEAIFDALPK